VASGFSSFGVGCGGSAAGALARAAAVVLSVLLFQVLRSVLGRMAR
jgi:hypothetical protein